MEANEWWGYLHVNGTVHPKRLYSSLDIKEAEESPFVRKVVPPFLATSREDALAYLMFRLQRAKYGR